MNTLRICCGWLAIGLLAGCSLPPRLERPLPRDAQPRVEAPRTRPAPVVDAKVVPVPAVTPEPVAVPAAPPEPAVATPAPSRDPAPAPAAAPAPRELPEPEPGVIYYGTDIYLVAPEYRPMLERYAEELKADPRRRLVVQAHADAEGPDEYNYALSEKRAETVIRLLRSLGVSERQLELRAYGSARPASRGNGPDTLARSRRVELVYR